MVYVKKKSAYWVRTCLSNLCKRKPPIGYVALVRHAAQTLYAPPRLIPRADRIVRAPLRSRDTVHLVRGAHVEALPIAAWRAQGPYGPLWVTAVKLRNRLERPVTLDPRDLRGQWRAASFQHARLSGAGASTDTTTVYLVADRRFDQALGPFAATAAASEPVSP